MPPIPNRFIAYVNAAFIKKVFHISQREWKSHIKHNCKLDDLGAGFEIAKGYRIGHIAEVYFQDAVGQGGIF